MMEGYLGKNKGWVYERGKWRAGMIGTKSDREVRRLLLWERFTR